MALYGAISGIVCDATEAYVAQEANSTPMSKLGGRSYPGDLKPEEAVHWMRILVNQFDGSTNQKESFARAVGHKSTDSGTFRRKLADARRYNLITPRGDYEATPLGRRIAQPRDENDRCDAVLQMLRNVDLLKDIDTMLRGEETPEDFWKVLTKTTAASPEEAQSVSSWIKDLYETLVAAREVLQGERTIDETEIPSPEEDQTESSLGVGGTENQAVEDGLVVKAGDNELRFGKVSDKNIEIAKQFLDSMKDDGGQGYQSRL